MIGSTSHVPLLTDVRAAKIETYVIGDAKLPRDVTAAVSEAAATVWSLSVANTSNTAIAS